MSMSVSSYEYSSYRIWAHGKAEARQKCILPLQQPHTHKGSSGRIVVLGGSARYTGAPYYAAVACLRTGADLVTICTAHEAAVPLKCYSPELMVQTVYRAADFDRITQNDPTVTPEQAATWMRDMVQSVMECCAHAHCLILGPGLGRCPAVHQAVAEIIRRARAQNLYMVLDADALFLLAQPEYRHLLRGYDKAVLTPNAMEYKRLAISDIHHEDDDALDSLVVVEKGLEDHIRVNGATVLTCAEVGGLKRPGGIGDVLAGALGTLVAWHKILVEGQTETLATTVDLPLTCWTACCLVKQATRRAFQTQRRAMSATDVLNELGTSMDEMESVWV